MIDLQAIASKMTVYPLRLTKGMELKETLLNFAKENRLSSPFILTCCGSVSSAKLRFATPKCGSHGKESVSLLKFEIDRILSIVQTSNSIQVKYFKEYFEICSLVGTLSNSGHLHVVLGREDGSTISGNCNSL